MAYAGASRAVGTVDRGGLTAITITITVIIISGAVLIANNTTATTIAAAGFVRAGI